MRYNPRMQGIQLNGLSAAVLALVVMVEAGVATAGQPSHFPSPHHPWTTREYVDFYFAHYNGNRALPHLRSEETARLFARIVHPENVRRVSEGPAPVERKRTELSVILATMGEIRAAYGYAQFVGEPLAEELTQIQSFMLFLIATAVKLESRAENAAGSDAWKTTVWNVVASLSEAGTYSDRQIAALSTALRVHYPQISGIFSISDKRKFRERIAELAAAASDAEARQAHLQLLAAARYH